MENNTNKKSSIINSFYIYLIIIFSAIFLTIMILIIKNNTFLETVDTSLASYFFFHRLRIFDYLFVIISYIGESKVIALFCLILLVLPNRKQIGMPVAIITLLSAITNFFIKIIIARARPDGLFLTTPTLFYSMPEGYSFPSGHAQTANVFYITLFIFLKRYLLAKSKLNMAQNTKSAFKKIFPVFLLISFCFLMCFARIYLAVHFFSDVMAGLSLTIVIISIIKLILIASKQYSFNYKYPTKNVN